MRSSIMAAIYHQKLNLYSKLYSVSIFLVIINQEKSSWFMIVAAHTFPVPSLFVS